MYIERQIKPTDELTLYENKKRITRAMLDRY